MRLPSMFVRDRVDDELEQLDVPNPVSAKRGALWKMANETYQALRATFDLPENPPPSSTPGRLEDLLGDPFEAIRLSDADREEFLKELAPRSESDVLPEPREDLQTAPEPAGEASSLMRVSLFGPPTIMLGDEELSGRLRRKSRELLAFFLLHPQVSDGSR